MKANRKSTTATRACSKDDPILTWIEQRAAIVARLNASENDDDSVAKEFERHIDLLLSGKIMTTTGEGAARALEASVPLIEDWDSEASALMQSALKYLRAPETSKGGGQ